MLWPPKSTVPKPVRQPNAGGSRSFSITCMPLSIYVNHAFVDGSHLSLFFQKIEQYLKEIVEDKNVE